MTTRKTDPHMSRRAVIKAGLGLVAASAALGLPEIAPAEVKMKPDLVMYQPTPKDGHQCSQCAQFLAPDHCTVVEGRISPKGWCAAFAPKGAS